MMTTLYFCIGEQKAREACRVHIGSRIGNAARSHLQQQRAGGGIGGIVLGS